MYLSSAHLSFIMLTLLFLNLSNNFCPSLFIMLSLKLRNSVKLASVIFGVYVRPGINTHDVHGHVTCSLSILALSSASMNNVYVSFFSLSKSPVRIIEPFWNEYKTRNKN